MTELIQYPEHEKLQKVKDKSQSIGEFLNWMQNKYTICTYHPVVYKKNGENYEIVEDREAPYPLHSPININIYDLLAEYFNIDQAKLEEEKRQALAELRR